MEEVSGDRCKAMTNAGTRCLRRAIIKGLCVSHFELMRGIDRKEVE